MTQAILFIADREINNFMKACDMCHEHKVFVTSGQTVSFVTSKPVNKEYFMAMIEKSKSQKSFWIPAIAHDGEMYISPEIMEISNGEKIMFLRRV